MTNFARAPATSPIRIQAMMVPIILCPFYPAAYAGRVPI
jgi:hypothetical protein